MMDAEQERHLISRVEEWKGPLGATWTRRNPATVEALDAHYLLRFGVTRTATNERILARVPRTSSVLEVGCSAGRQLDALAESGFTELEGIDLSPDAVLHCKWPARVGDARDLPFADDSFDLVMTSGALMHVPPAEKGKALSEMKRVARRWIYGCEMWTEGFLAWDFGDLMPPAWTCDWLPFVVSPDWPVVESLRLESTEGRPLQFYLLEKVA